MEQYLKLAEHVLTNGHEKEDRTGTGTISTFGYQMRFDLSKGFPLMTTKRMFIEGIIYELLWFLKGDTNIKYLLDYNVNIWNRDAYRGYNEKREHQTLQALTYAQFVEMLKTDEDMAREHGELGPVYGKQWRSWSTYDSGSIDQLTRVIEQIKTNPDSRRHIVSAWNVADIEDMTLPPCHVMFQFYVNDGKLSCQLYQRSGDLFLGVPFNIASYALLTHMVAQECGLQVGEFIHTLGDVHIYKNHIEQMKLQISRTPKRLPRLYLNPDKGVLDFEYEDFVLSGYDPYPTIKGVMST